MSLPQLAESWTGLALGRIDGLDQLSRSRKWNKRQAKNLLRRKFAYLQANIPTATVSCVTATAKTIVGAAAAANQPIKILEQLVSHDGATSTNAPSIVELARCTFGGAGTATSVTPSKKDPGRAETIQTTGTKNYSAEPTTITAWRTVNVPTYNGLYHYLTPDSRTLLVVGGQGYVIRVTAPATTNACATIEFEE